MSSRSKSKRATREYEQKQTMMVAYYRSNPIEFIESHLNIELNSYQRFMINMAFKFKRFNKYKVVNNG